MVAFIVHTNPSDERARLLSNLMGQLGRNVIFVDTIDAVADSPLVGAGGQVLILVPDTSPNSALAEHAIRFAEGKRRQSFVVYISDEITADHYKALVRSEVGEWVRWTALATELLEVLRRLQGRAAPSGDSAKVVGLLGTSGGVGNTTLALEIGIHFALSKGKTARRVCLLDLNFQYSALPEYLDVEPRLAIVEITDRPERIDQQIIDIFTTPHPSGLHVFAGAPSQIDYSRIDERVIFGLLDVIGRRYDLVIVDLPTIWMPWTGNIGLGSDALILTGVYNVPSVKLTSSRLAQLDELGVPRERIAIAVNQCPTSLLGGIVRQSDVDGALSGRRVFYIQRDNRLAGEAVNTGQPMLQVGPKSKIAKNIRKLAAWVESVTTSANVRQNFSPAA